MSRIGSLAGVALLVSGVAHAQASMPEHMGMMGGATMFVVRVENVSTPQTLQLSNGQSAPAPTAPVLWLIHTAVDPVFTDGRVDRSLGLERLAEDGNPTLLAGALGGRPGIISVGADPIPVGDTQPGPITPGKAYEFTVTASPGQKLTLAFMFGQSNDLFYAPAGNGIDLFQSGRPFSGDLTAQFVLWDAGTEVNEEPGLGPSQAPRQAQPNMGASERRPVAQVKDGFRYPAAFQVIRVTIAPLSGANMMMMR
jgi:hypothetical protein